MVIRQDLDIADKVQADEIIEDFMNECFMDMDLVGRIQQWSDQYGSCFMYLYDLNERGVHLFYSTYRLCGNPDHGEIIHSNGSRRYLEVMFSPVTYKWTHDALSFLLFGDKFKNG